MLAGYTPVDLASCDRFVRPYLIVEDRFQRVRLALRQYEVTHAVLGGHAVAAWVATADPAATRATPTVDVLLRREDIDSAAHALSVAGIRVEATEQGYA